MLHAVDSFRPSSNIKVMAVRDLPLEVQVTKHIVLLHELTLLQRCSSSCRIDEDCKQSTMCTKCRRTKFTRKVCLAPN